MFLNQYHFFKIGGLTLGILIALFFSVSNPVYSYTTQTTITEQVNEEGTHSELATEEPNTEHQFAAGWSVIPFILLLAMIATGPLFFEHFWHHNYPKVAVA